MHLCNQRPTMSVLQKRDLLRWTLCRPLGVFFFFFVTNNPSADRSMSVYRTTSAQRHSHNAPAFQLRVSNLPGAELTENVRWNLLLEKYQMQKGKRGETMPLLCRHLQVAKSTLCRLSAKHEATTVVKNMTRTGSLFTRKQANLREANLQNGRLPSSSLAPQIKRISSGASYADEALKPHECCFTVVNPYPN